MIVLAAALLIMIAEYCFNISFDLLNQFEKIYNFIQHGWFPSSSFDTLLHRLSILLAIGIKVRSLIFFALIVLFVVCCVDFSTVAAVVVVVVVVVVILDISLALSLLFD